MSRFDSKILSNINRPSRYLGSEVNAVRKEPSVVDVSIALAFPDVYEVGMSHQGLKILYQILNSHKWLAAERVFSPWIDMEKELTPHQVLLTTLESGRPLLDFDIIGFSLQHELSYTNVLTILHLSKIPFLSKDRDSSFPLIIAGGPACFNPEPIAPIFDLFVIGDGEETAVKVCEYVREAKRQNIKKDEILLELSKLRGIYVPSFFDISYLPEGRIGKIIPKRPDYKLIEKAIISDIDKYPFPAEQVIPFTQY